MKRVRVPELMDARGADDRELWRSLHDLEEVNRWLGGRRSATRRVMDLVRSIPTEGVRLLDVATGAADIPISIVRAARSAGREISITATDLHPTTLGFAREAVDGFSEIEVSLADGLSLSFEDSEFDLAMCCMALHHFDRGDAIQLLRELGRVASRGFVVTDLARSRLALLGSEFLARTAWRNHPITRHDGPASVRAAFTPDELRDLAAEAGFPEAVVRSEPVFRLSLVVDRTGREAADAG